MFVAILSLLLLGTQSSLANTSALYPKNFLWGATDTNLNKTELKNAAQIGLNALIVPIDWEQIEPESGTFSHSAIKHYRDILQELKARNIKPIITLHNSTQPAWFLKHGGWLSPESPRSFLLYANFVVANLKDLCDTWITFHEPTRFTSNVFPNDPDAANEATFQIARAHRIVAQIIHEAQGPSYGGHGPDGQVRGVGITNLTQTYEASDPQNNYNNQATAFVNETYNWSYIKTLTTGRMEITPPAWTGLKNFKRILPSQDLPPWDVGPSLDWIGIDYFTKQKVSVTASQSITLHDAEDVYSDGLEDVLRQASQQFVYPLIITGNRIAENPDHFIELDYAVFGHSNEPPLDIRGYFHQALTDPVFGLFDGETPRANAAIYTAKINSASR